MPSFSLRWSSSQQHTRTKSTYCRQISIHSTEITPRCGESPRVKFQRVSSEDCSTPVRGQAVNQSAELRSAFFATAQMLIFHIFSSVHPFSCRGHGIRDSRFSWQERGQAVKQSAEMQSALEFFATSVILCSLTFECVNSSSRSSEKHVHLVFSKEALEYPNTSRQSRASHGDE